MGQQWYLSFDLKPTGTTGALSNILHLTRGGDESRIGDKMPSVSFLPRTSRLQVCNAVGYNKSHCFESPTSLELNDYVNVRIRQTWDVKYSTYRIYIELDNNLVYNITNIAAREFTNMLLYVSDPWNPPAKAEIKNLVFKNLPFGTSFSFFVVERAVREKRSEGAVVVTSSIRVEG